MHPIQRQRRGAALLCLSALLTACADKPKVVVETREVRVEVPAYVKLDPALTAAVPEPKLPEGGIINDDVAEFVERLKAAVRQANDQLARIRALQP